MSVRTDAIVIERNEGRIVALHHVHRPDFLEPGFYRAIVSSEAFRNRELKRIYSQPAYTRGAFCKHHYVLKLKSEWEMDQASICESLKSMGIDHTPEHSGKPFYKYESIWAFYKAIGYDYKRKKYVTKA